MKDDLATRKPGRWLVRLEALGVLALATFLVLAAVRVVHEASLQEVHPADVIVVFGAASMPGIPRPCCARVWITLSIFFSKALRRWSSQREAQLPIPVSAKAAWGAII